MPYKTDNFVGQEKGCVRGLKSDMPFTAVLAPARVDTRVYVRACVFEMPTANTALFEMTSERFSRGLIGFLCTGLTACNCLIRLLICLFTSQ